MSKINKTIEIVRTDSAKLNSMGIPAVARVQEILSRYYTHVGVTTISKVEDLSVLLQKQPDLCVLGFKRLHFEGTDTNEAHTLWISEFLDQHGINYAGSGKNAIEADYHKDIGKQIIHRSGLPTAGFFMASPGHYLGASQLPLPFPIFIKPPDSGGGKGIGDDSVVRDFTAFQTQVKYISQNYGTAALVEQYLEGREFSVAILNSVPQSRQLIMPIEIITEPNSRGDRILGKKVKKQDNERVIAVNDPYVRQQVCDLAAQAFTALEGRDYGRIDLRMDKAGKPYFLEANFIPGLGRGGYLSRASKINIGMDYDQIILTIIESALQRAPDHIVTEPLPTLSVVNAFNTV